MKQARPANPVDTRLTPVSVDDLKAQLRIDHSDQDRMLVQKIKAATAEIEEYIESPILAREMKLELAEFCDSIELIPSPVWSVVSIKYYDSDNVQQTLDPANYELTRPYRYFAIEKATGVSWPTVYDRQDAIEILFQAGWANGLTTVPPPLAEAVLMRAASRYAMPEESGVGASVWELKEALAIKALLSPYLNMYA